MARYDNYTGTPIMAAGNPQALAIFADKSFAQVWNENNLTEDDVEVSANEVEGFNTIYNLIFAVDGKKWAVPLSTKLDPDKLEDSDYLGSCVFRSGFTYKKENGNVVKDAEGNPVLSTKPYLNLGNPGIRFDNISKLFEPEVVETAPKTNGRGIPKK